MMIAQDRSAIGFPPAHAQPPQQVRTAAVFSSERVRHECFPGGQAFAVAATLASNFARLVIADRASTPMESKFMFLPPSETVKVVVAVRRTVSSDANCGQWSVFLCRVLVR